MALVIRPFVSGRDEPIWVDIVNRAHEEDEDFVPTTVAEFERWKRAPKSTDEGRFVAELDGMPVGTVFADADRRRAEKKGSMDGPNVVPQHRRKGVGTALCRKALSSLRQRGMERVLAFTRDAPESVGFAESLGFSRVRTFSLMRRSLADIPHGIGESPEITLEFLGRTDTDLALLTNLDNEAFKEHFNHRDKTLEETRFVLRASADGGDKDFITVARLGPEPVGFLIYGYAPRENEMLHRSLGGLWVLGVLKQYRGQGIGKRLMIEGMEHLRAEGMTLAELHVDDTNETNAKVLYERLGFRVIRRRFTWQKDLTGFDASAQPV